MVFQENVDKRNKNITAEIWQQIVCLLPFARPKHTNCKVP